MENPATWTKATHVIQAALDEAYKQQTEGVIGLSMARIIHDALEREHLLAEGDGWIAVTEKLPDLDVDVLTYSKHDWGIHVGRQEVDMGNRRIWCEHRIPEPRELPYVTHWRRLPTPPSVQEEKGSSV